MRISRGAVVMIALCLLGAGIGAGAVFNPGVQSATTPTDRVGGGPQQAQPSASPPDGGNESGLTGTLNRSHAPPEPAEQGRPSDAQTPGTERVERIVVVNQSAVVDTDALTRLGVTIEARSETFLQVMVERSNISTVRALPWVEQVRPPLTSRPSNQHVSEGVNTIGAADLHAQGITGQGVAVGVLSCEGFDLSAGGLSEHIAATKSFRQAGLDNGGDNSHGTSVAEIVAETAPDADLYLVNYDGAVGYEQALGWLDDQNVDVIAYSCNRVSEPNDGSGRVSTITGGVADANTTFFNSAGNYGRSHYEAPFADGNTNGFHDLSSTNEVNEITDGDDSPTGGLESGDSFEIELQWDQWPARADNASISLVRFTGTEYKTVKRSQPEGSLPIETLSYTVQEDGRYFIAVYSTELSPGDTIEITTLTDGYQLDHYRYYSSVGAPAVAENVAGIAANPVGTTKIAPYSSAGPTDDGRRAILVTAPAGVTVSKYNGRFQGTSAAAPHAAGVAALLLDINTSLTRDQTYTVLSETADDIGPTGVDRRAGGGRVNATAAANAVATPTPNQAPTANANGPYSVDEGGSVALDASGSSDSDGSITTYSWTVTSGPGSVTSGTYQAPTDVASDTQATVALTVIDDDGATATDTASITVNDGGESDDGGSTTVAVEVDAAPDGLRLYNVRLSGPSSATITDVQPGVISGGFQIRSGGTGDSSVTARAADLAGNVEAGAGRQPLFTVTYDQSVTQANLSVTVTRLEDDNGNSIPTNQVSLAVGGGTTPFPDGLPGTGSQPTDPDNDGIYEDVNGDGAVTFDDAIDLAFVPFDQLPPAQQAALDFDNDGDVDFDDAIDLAFQT